LLSDLLSKINLETGKQQWDSFNSYCEEEFEDNIISSIGVGVESYSGFWSFVISPLISEYEEVEAALVQFFGALDITIDSRGYNFYHGDPVELFYRYVNGKVVVAEYVPFESAEADDAAVTSGVYADWHRGLPGFRVGSLNFDLNDKRLVFTGKPSSETIRLLELATNEHIEVEEKISDKTDLLVVCENFESKDVENAETMEVDTCTEAIFNWSCCGLLEIHNIGTVGHETEKKVIDDEWEAKYTIVNYQDETSSGISSGMGKTLTGKVWKTYSTESGLIIKLDDHDMDNQDEVYPMYGTQHAMLEDMNQIKHGDFVTVVAKSFDRKKEVLICTLKDRIPRANEKGEVNLGFEKILKGKVWKTNKTESGLMIKIDRSYDEIYEKYGTFRAILEDMSQIKHGDFVKVVAKSYDSENEVLICTLKDRKPRV